MLKQLVLKRVYTENITFGHLFDGDDFVCHFFELPWKQNRPKISCIPEGLYEFSLIDRHEHLGLCYYCETEIEGRSEIFIHTANLTTQIKGCLAPVSTLRGDIGGDSSKMALLEIKKIAGDRFLLLIE